MNAHSLFINIGSIFVARMLSPLIRMGLVLFLSRFLGAKGLGEYQVMMTYFALFEVLPTLGLRRFMTREIAKQPPLALQYIQHGCVLGLLVSIAALAIMNVASAGYSGTIRQGILLLSLALFPSTMLVFCEATFIAPQRAAYIAVLTLSENLLLMLLGCFFLWNGFGVISIVATIAILRLFTAGVGLTLVMRLCPRLPWQWDGAFRREMLRQAPVFLGTVLASNLFWRLDILMLSRLRSAEEIGLYAAALRLIILCQEIPKSVLINILPPLSARYPDAMRPFRTLVECTAKYLLIYAFPVTIGAIVLAPDIITMIFNAEFLAAALILSILVMSLVPFGMMNLLGNVLTATHHQKIDLATNGLGVLLNLGLNLVFIPRYGALGAAYTTLITVTVCMLV